jgi:site-specific recombinase XerD
MFDQFFRHRAVLERLRSGPLGPYLEDVCAMLIEQHYAKYSVRLRLRLLGVLSRWLEQRGLRVEDLDERRAAEFLAEPARQRTWVKNSKAVVRLLLGYLRDRAILKVPEIEVDDTPMGRVEREFARYLVEERGYSQATVRRYLPPVRRFCGERFGSGPLSLSDLSAADVTRFILRSSRPRGARSSLGALRSFYRFLHLSGQIAFDLPKIVFRVAHWRLSDVPRSLPGEQVERLLKSCDRSLAMGKRDYALLLLIARLGLRAGEVAAMTLEDLDWQAGEITVRGKGRRVDRLPMLHDVGAALAAYLKDGRPCCATRLVFVGLRAPHRGFAGASTVSLIVKSSLRRAGLCPPLQGAHLLRHSLATEMLRQHASLGEIGQILRHRQLCTTEIYAKVDFEALRTLAQPWPGGVS